jgi:NAD(P)-dependent dehydrogenase (short-subunit alcohol dehydrogenase family)
MGQLDAKVALVTGGSAGIDGDVTGIVSDVADLSALDTLFATINERSGRLDAVVANAGGGNFVGLEDVTEEHYNSTFDINVKGLVFTVQKALPGMSVYAATKAAIRNFARSWAIELAPRGIRVSALCPGPVDTPGMADLVAQLPGDDGGSTVDVPMGRLGHPDEIASGALFLASSESSFLTGSDLVLDGGQAV